MYRSFSVSLLGLAMLLGSCKNNVEEKGEDPLPEAVTPLPAGATAFSGDTTYNYVKTQVEFGPRVPGTPAQKATASWLQEKLRQSCDTVYRQDVTVKGGDGSTLPCYNLIGVINPAAKQRYLLLAHWDTRPWADEDVQNKDKPIDGADDGASGVAVLLEIARQLKVSPLPASLGVDILLVDVEDWGKTEWGDTSYGLGTQYWAKHPHIPGYTALGGILLDMVGAKGARFPMEYTSAQAAGPLQQEVWKAASEAGFSSYFLYDQGNGVTDDHTFINSMTRIPTIDIIHLQRNSMSVFPAHWHTHNDNMSVIDPATLEAVGKTVLQFLRRKGISA